MRYGFPELMHDFSNTMVLIPGWHKHAMLRMAREVDTRHLAEDGRESEPHITVKYGLSDDKPSPALLKALKWFGPIRATFGKTSLFKNDDAHVVKIDIHSPDLNRLNALIAKTVETPGSSHPTYEPHATVAYLKPAYGHRHREDGTLDGQGIVFDTVVFSSKDGKRYEIPLGKKG